MKRKVYNKNEIHTRKLMVEKGISINMLADHLEVTPQAILGRLSRGTIEPLILAIKELDSQLTNEEGETVREAK